MEPGRFDPRHNVVLADITVIRALGAAHSRQAADLAAVAATLRSATPPSCAEAFGPVGARFVAALAEAVALESHAVARLGERIAAAGHTAGTTAAAYGGSEDRAGRAITSAGA
jgi:Excreted virulence factor EspC, type VII ESX diderm